MLVGLKSVLLTPVLIVCGAHAGERIQKSDSWRLNTVEFTGLQRCTRDRAMTLSGLRIGQSVDVATLDAATARLARSGFFKRVNYTYLYKGNQLDLTLVAQEGKWIPVVFDNFAWFSDDEIAKAVKAEEPLFDGNAPTSGEVINSIKRALERLLGDRGLPAQVEYIPAYERTGEDREHIYRAAGVKVPVCALRFPNAAVIGENDLAKLSQPLLAGDYSMSFVRDFAQLNLIPAYRERGHLRARFSLPTATTRSDDNCKNGVQVTLAGDEGARYTWEKAEWTGNGNLTSEELSVLFGMKPGDLANGLKIDAGIKSVASGYGKRGFIDVRLNTAPAFDDEKKLVAYRITIAEGSQYRMGAFTLNGLSASDAESLRKKWKLETGQVYDAAYLDEFMKKEMRGVASSAKKVEFVVKPDRHRLSVDVIITVIDKPVPRTPPRASGLADRQENCRSI